MRRGQLNFDFDLRAYFEAVDQLGGDHRGTELPWSYLGDVRAELRRRVVATHPRLVTLTERERRVADLERSVASVTATTTPSPLASL
jgi:hypothetical protein